MRLEHLLAAASPGSYRVTGDATVEIAGLKYDSRAVNPSDLFFSLARDPARNRSNLNEALSRGAAAVVVARWSGEEGPAATLVECERPRLLMAAVASRFFAAPSARIDLIGITGTSGKTTSSYLLAAIFEAEGNPAGIIGTIGVFIGKQPGLAGLTTPESVDFEASLVEMERAGVKRVAAEISSIGIAEGRVEELQFRAALFTNLGRDHLDYHLTEEAYFAAKLRLFTELLARSRRHDPVAVARGDEPWGRKVLAGSTVRALSFGLSADCDVYPLRYQAGVEGIDALIHTPGKNLEIHSPLLGVINLYNILGAVAVSVALGIDADVVAEGVRRCSGAPGRLEPVEAIAGVKILVDYAHKPDALQGVLETLRALLPARVICVFGCGGDRDRGKRPIMGEIAARLADVSILTSDNPRTEDPLKIIAEVEAGLAAGGAPRRDAGDRRLLPGYLVEPDRRAAIALALRGAQPGDIVLIAGKGHEAYQILGADKIDFDDRTVVREAVMELEKHQCA